MEKSPDNFCYFPFIQLALDPNGQVQPCCWKADYNLGDIKKNSIQEIWNGPQAQRLRQEFLNGTPKSCAKQMQQLKCHRTSARWQTSGFDFATVQTQPIKRLDLRLNGKCNLQCIMCEVWKMPNGNYTEENFWSSGQEIFPGLEEIILLGGEPFIQKDTFRLIDEVSKVNHRCRWGFITNGQFQVSDKILKALDKIDIRYIQVSLDSVNPETYQKIRKLGKLDKVLRALQEFIALSRTRQSEGREFTLSISMCIQKNNWREVESFCQFAEPLGLCVALQFVVDPFSESLLSLPLHEREEIYQQLLVAQNRLNHPQLDPILTLLQQPLDLSPSPEYHLPS